MDESVACLIEAAAGADAGSYERLFARLREPKRIARRQLYFGGSAMLDSLYG